MSEPNRDDEIQRLLVMAAANLGLGPETDLSRTNTVRVVGQVLLWLGLSAAAIKQNWAEAEEAGLKGNMRKGKALSLNEQAYEVLVRMVHERKSPLFEGQGNWGEPGKPDRPASWPHYNSCRLTIHGQQVAERLLSEYPQYRKRA